MVDYALLRCGNSLGNADGGSNVGRAKSGSSSGGGVVAVSYDMDGALSWA